MGKARITYRFGYSPHSARSETQQKTQQSNREQHSDGSGFGENRQRPVFDHALPAEPEYSEPSRDYISWEDAFDKEASRIEREIRRSGSPHYTSPESIETRESPETEAAFAHIPFYDESLHTAYRRKSGGVRWLSALSAFAGAILTGIVLGMLVLSLFRGDFSPIRELAGMGAAGAGEAAEGAVTGLDGAGPESGALTGSAEGLPGPGGDGQRGAVSLELPEATYYFVQNGVFSGREGADAALDMLREKGLSGAVETGAAFSVYAGAAVTRDDALLISHHLQNEDLEVYVKPYVLPAVDAISGSGTAADGLGEYVRISRELAGTILSISAMRLNEARPGPLGEAERESLARLHQQWTEQANRAVPDTDADKPLLDKMNTALNSAVMTLEQYDKNPSHAYLWQAQAAAAEHLISQKALLEAAM